MPRVLESVHGFVLRSRIPGSPAAPRQHPRHRHPRRIHHDLGRRARPLIPHRPHRPRRHTCRQRRQSATPRKRHHHRRTRRTQQSLAFRTRQHHRCLRQIAVQDAAERLRPLRLRRQHRIRRHRRLEGRRLLRRQLAQRPCRHAALNCLGKICRVHQGVRKVVVQAHETARGGSAPHGAADNRHCSPTAR